jgi:hypothetical protein
MPEDYDFAAVMYPDRVCDIRICLTSSQLQRLASVMQEQFPALIHLQFETPSYRHPAPALPDAFLGGSAPRLRFLTLKSIPFPALPKLLLSATDLVELALLNIPHSGYISPEATVTGLAALANLRNLHIEFESRLSRPDRESRRPPPPTRTVLSTLTCFVFHGASEYLEDLVARVDAPLLDKILITFFHQRIFDIPQLAQFMRRTPTFQPVICASVHFSPNNVVVESFPQNHETSRLTISSKWLEWRLPSLAQVFTSFFPSVHMVERLTFDGFRHWTSQRQADTENMQWLEIFRQLTSVRHIFVSTAFVRCIALVLQDLVGERVTEVLPALESLSLEGLRSVALIPIQERKAIAKFVAARSLSDHPVAISDWNR